MRPAEFAAFCALLDDVAGLYPKGIVTEGQKAMFFRALSDVSLAAVRAGLDAHVKDPVRGRFMPMPADVLGQIEGLVADDGRPGAEEAWASALNAEDEYATVVWTSEAAEAWAVASTVLRAGDEVGARMAFKEVYIRLVAEARRARRAPHWLSSLGFDSERRAVALEAAVARGILPMPDALALPAPSEPFAALNASSSMSESVRERLGRLRAKLTRGSTGPTIGEQALQRTAELKRESATKVEAAKGNGA